VPTIGPVADVSSAALAASAAASSTGTPDAAELPAMIGKRSRDLPPEQRREVVHADDLVPMG